MFLKKMNDMLIYATIWIDLKGIGWVKKAKLKMPHTVWFHVYNILEIIKLLW